MKKKDKGFDKEFAKEQKRWAQEKAAAEAGREDLYLYDASQPVVLNPVEVAELNRTIDKIHAARDFNHAVKSPRWANDVNRLVENFKTPPPELTS
jgi:hypothetical protein